MNEGKSDQTSIFAAEGTVAHALAEHCLNEQILSATDMVGKDMLDFDPDLAEQIADTGVDTVISLEMAEYIQVYLDYVRDYAMEAQVVMVEERVDFSEWVPDGSGTADFMALVDTHLHVFDLKYGKGVAVSAYENTQGMMYALGAIVKLNGYQITDVTIHIVQPRLDNISDYHRTKRQIVRWAENEVRPKALEALSPTAPLTAGEKQCQWCKAKGECPAYATFCLEKAVEGFDFIKPDMELKAVKKLDADDYNVLLPFLKMFKNWIDAVEDSAKDLLHSGEDIADFKLVEGRSNRVWLNEEDAAKKLKNKLDEDELFVRKLISPTQAEKLLGKNDPLFKNLVHKPEGKPTIAHKSDRRPAIAESRVAGFEFEKQP